MRVTTRLRNYLYSIGTNHTIRPTHASCHRAKRTRQLKIGCVSAVLFAIN